jgi:hypothetical protein
MIRLGFVILMVLAGVACEGEEEPEGPGRPMLAQAPLCQWKTPCPKAEPAPDGGVPDGGPLQR